MAEFFKKHWREMHDAVAYLRSIITAYDEMQACNLEPGSDAWTVNRALFLREVRPRVVRLWCAAQEKRPEEFPYTDDSVTLSWMDWRKALDHVKTRTRSDCFGEQAVSLFD